MAREPPIVVPVCRTRKYLSVKHQIICWCECCDYRTCMVLLRAAGSSASPWDHTIYRHPQTKDPFDANSTHPTSARRLKLLAPSSEACRPDARSRSPQSHSVLDIRDKSLSETPGTNC